MPHFIVTVPNLGRFPILSTDVPEAPASLHTLGVQARPQLLAFYSFGTVRHGQRNGGKALEAISKEKAPRLAVLAAGHTAC